MKRIKPKMKWSAPTESAHIFQLKTLDHGKIFATNTTKSHNWENPVVRNTRDAFMGKILFGFLILKKAATELQGMKCHKINYQAILFWRNITISAA